MHEVRDGSFVVPAVFVGLVRLVCRPGLTAPGRGSRLAVAAVLGLRRGLARNGFRAASVELLEDAVAVVRLEVRDHRHLPAREDGPCRAGQAIDRDTDAARQADTLDAALIVPVLLLRVRLRL